ncbi:MAG: hypothetical protein ABIQ30_11135 [Devosia sp.]
MAGTVPPPHKLNGDFAVRHDAAKRAAVRVDYEGDELTLREIASKHDIAGSTLHEWVRIGRWRMRQPRRIDPNDLVAKMLILLDRQIADLETALTNGTNEVAMLAKLVTTLDRVLVLKDRTTKAAAPPSRRVQTLRSKIAERLAELNRD